jgi:hypothetical protein
VRLTPLGTWWTNVLLRQAGAVAPVIGELAGLGRAAGVHPAHDQLAGVPLEA